MARVTVGEELRGLFRAYEAGDIATSDFETRKHQLLDWSKCHLMRRLPKHLQTANRS